MAGLRVRRTATVADGTEFVGQKRRNCRDAGVAIPALSQCAADSFGQSVARHWQIETGRESNGGADLRYPWGPSCCNLSDGLAPPRLPVPTACPQAKEAAGGSRQH